MYWVLGTGYSALSPPAASDRRTPAMTNTPARVLIVEDSPTQARQLALLLEDAGFAPQTAPDAESGFEHLLREPFDLVLSDLLLPGDSGFDLCRRIKADARVGHIPVVVLTSQ